MWFDAKRKQMEVKFMKSSDRIESETKAVSGKLAYHTPELKEYGVIANVFRSADNTGDDGTGGFPTDSGS